MGMVIIIFTLCEVCAAGLCICLHWYICVCMCVHICDQKNICLASYLSYNSSLEVYNVDKDTCYVWQALHLALFLQ